MCTPLNGHKPLWERCDDQRGVVLAFPPCSARMSFFATSLSIRTKREHRCVPISSLLAECSSSLSAFKGKEFESNLPFALAT